LFLASSAVVTLSSDEETRALAVAAVGTIARKAVD
jgi:hypothetical protein